MAQEITNAELDEIMAEWEATTPGPWTCGPEEVDGLIAINSGAYCVLTGHVTGIGKYENSEFAAHSHQNIPRLVAALRTARAENAELKANEIVIGALVDKVDALGHEYVKKANAKIDALRARLALIREKAGPVAEVLDKLPQENFDDKAVAGYGGKSKYFTFGQPRGLADAIEGGE